MNEVLKAIETRRSIREFSAKEVSREDLDMILKAGTYAPSGMNRQPVIFVAVTDKETRDELSEMNARIMGTDSDPFYGAQTVIVVLADKTAPTYVYDGALAMGNLMLAAHSLGIAAGSTGQRKNLTARKAESFLRSGASLATMRE